MLAYPEDRHNPFFLMFPDWALVPMVGLATVGTVIASQAVISGAFSLTQQAFLMGYLPRLKIEHTSETERGQIYLPGINRYHVDDDSPFLCGGKTSLALAYVEDLAIGAFFRIRGLCISGIQFA